MSLLYAISINVAYLSVVHMQCISYKALSPVNFLNLVTFLTQLVVYTQMNLKFKQFLYFIYSS